MSCLDATFTIRPRSPIYWQSLHNQAELFCQGADFSWASPTDFSSLYTTDRFFFDAAYASDPTLDYTQWTNLKKARYLTAYIDLGAFGTQKQAALVFGFDVMYQNFDGRILVYTSAGLLQDVKLAYGDNQFMLELESLDQPLFLNFIHAGGYWFFKGLSGYVI